MEVGLKFYKTKWGICRKLCAKNELTFSFALQLAMATLFDVDD
jgi:predicted metal-dependent hydrolase